MSWPVKPGFHTDVCWASSNSICVSEAECAQLTSPIDPIYAELAALRVRLADEQAEVTRLNSAWIAEYTLRKSQAEALRALRGFANEAVSWAPSILKRRAKDYGLLDSDGNPTPLLTGEQG